MPSWRFERDSRHRHHLALRAGPQRLKHTEGRLAAGQGAGGSGSDVLRCRSDIPATEGAAKRSHHVRGEFACLR